MIRNIRLVQHKGVTRVDLMSLGRINVVCGKNNSGKTTLLEAMVNSKTRHLGIVLDASVADDLHQTTDQLMGWRGSQHAYLSRIYLNQLKTFFSEEMTIFYDDISRLSREIVNHVNTNAKMQAWEMNHTQIGRFFQDLLRDSIDAVMVSPRRTLELSGRTDGPSRVDSQGNGLLFFLFRSKNLPETDKDAILYQNIQDAFRDISGGYTFQIFWGESNGLTLHFRRENGDWQEASDCGLGLQDLLVLLYFILVDGFALVCIEEPESHLHPDLQRRLLRFMTSRQDRQYVLSTHSNVFLDGTFVDKVFFTQCDSEVTVSEATGRASILTDLGYSVVDNLLSDLIVLVEGPTDVSLLSEFLRMKRVADRFVVRFWPLGGDIMDRLDLEVLGGYKTLALIDNDPGSRRIRNRFKKRCQELNIHVTQLSRYAIENYLTLDAIRAEFPGKVPDSLRRLSHSKKVEDQLGFNIKKASHRIARRMDLSDLQGTDLMDFLEIVESECSKTSMSVAGQ